MAKIWNCIREHVRLDFSAGYYVAMLVFLAVCISLNYFFSIEPRIESHQGLSRVGWYMVLYGTAYFGTVIIVTRFRGNVVAGPSWQFLILATAGIFIISLDSGFPFLNKILSTASVDGRIYYWAHKLSANLQGLFLIGIPLLAVYLLIPACRSGSFGLGLRHYDLRPYLLLALLIIPVIGLASFSDHFTDYYPVYRINSAGTYLGTPDWIPAIIFEFCYGIDFFNVELFFRGFLVIGFSQILGRHSIMPMVATYCFLHFGKPLGETISSVFGGYLLGVISFYTRGIWGGVIIHLSVAWSMEMTAWLQKFR